jgi:DNA polymerase III subunit gamma/tau
LPDYAARQDWAKVGFLCHVFFLNIASGFVACHQDLQAGVSFMASQSLYRKWRSQTFSDLVGQEPVVRTLKNALNSGNLAHAYLFTGPRGTGKTSMARLLAKTINCLHPKDGEPCNACEQCHEITVGSSFNVIEIDAASNRGIDSIRELREKVMVPPTNGKYKVYILDEAHMLTTEAFNALLKTLEEPPPHAIFVMATTDVHKMLPTVLSRCQRFDFKRFATRQLVDRLRFVAEQEQVVLEPGAAELIARAAAGGMRDALSLLDQAIAYSGNEISLNQVQVMLGVADPRAIQKFVSHIANLDSSAGLHLIHELADAGADLRQINLQVAEYCRAMMLTSAGASIAEILDLTEDEMREIVQVAQLFSLGELTEYARIFAQNDLVQKSHGTPQLGLELALLACIELHRRVQSDQSTVPTPTAQSRPSPTPTAQPRLAPGQHGSSTVGVNRASPAVSPQLPTNAELRTSPAVSPQLPTNAELRTSPAVSPQLPTNAELRTSPAVSPQLPTNAELRTSPSSISLESRVGSVDEAQMQLKSGLATDAAPLPELKNASDEPNKGYGLEQSSKPRSQATLVVDVSLKEDVAPTKEDVALNLQSQPASSQVQTTQPPEQRQEAVSEGPSLTVEEVREKWEYIKRRVKTKKDSSMVASLLSWYAIVAVEGTKEIPVVVIQANTDIYYKALQQNPNHHVTIEWALKVELNQECKLRLLPPGQSLQAQISKSAPASRASENSLSTSTVARTPQLSPYHEQSVSALRMPQGSPKEQEQSKQMADRSQKPTDEVLHHSPLARSSIMGENTAVGGTRQEIAVKKAESDQVVREAMRMFKAEIKNIQLK